MQKRPDLVASLILVLAAAMGAAGCASSPDASSKLASPQLEPGHWSGAIATEMDGRYHPIVGTKGMVVADDRQAAEWGAEILRRGGNAVDAAVATAFAMSVTRPHFASLGGGGFMVYCPAAKPAGDSASKQAGASSPKPACYALDYREEAPGAASRDMYIRDGKPHTDLSQNGALASGVPGVTAGLLTALEKFGTMPRQKLLSHPIELARGGFLFSGHEESAALDRWSDFNDESKKLFGCGPRHGGVPSAPCPPGTLIKQADLASVLGAISRKGIQGFYEGPVAKKIVDGLHASGGIMTLEDLKAYKAQWRTPVHAQFEGMEVVSMPPPSAGGTVLLEMLGFMERASRGPARSGLRLGQDRSCHRLCDVARVCRSRQVLRRSGSRPGAGGGVAFAGLS